jgi:hypothetical protein
MESQRIQESGDSRPIAVVQESGPVLFVVTH